MMWTEVWVSALVAVVVTLAIEYAAKPHLEARKERILNAARERREAETLVQLGWHNYGMLLDLLDTQPATPRDRDLTRNETRRLMEELAEQGIALVRCARLVDDAADRVVFEMLTTLAGTFLAVGRFGTQHVTEKDVLRMVTLCTGLLENSRRSRRGRTLRAEADVWLDENIRGWRERRNAAAAAPPSRPSGKETDPADNSSS
jgi:hypothetical protein